MEILIPVLGMIITIIPVIIFVIYLMKHIQKQTSFDYHLELVKEKKGILGLAIAYLEKILAAITISSFGLLLNEFFHNTIFLRIFIISLVILIIVKYIDEKNEK